MATWGVHIRLAEAILNMGYDLDEKSFLVGNIGPDCGKPNEDWSRFTPPTELSHWKDKDNNIRPELFYEKHLNMKIQDKREWSFLIGYYVHLITDIEWSKMIQEEKSTDTNYAKLKEDRNFIWTIKEDWYDLDHLYFRDNPENVFWAIFQHIEDFPNYLDYYPSDAIITQTKYITDYYQNPSTNLDREYKYLTMEEMNRFLEKTTKLIDEELQLKINQVF